MAITAFQIDVLRRMAAGCQVRRSEHRQRYGCWVQAAGGLRCMNLDTHAFLAMVRAGLLVNVGREDDARHGGWDDVFGMTQKARDLLALEERPAQEIGRLMDDGCPHDPEV